jgi:hypothetical protein
LPSGCGGDTGGGGAFTPRVRIRIGAEPACAC